MENKKSNILKKLFRKAISTRTAEDKNLLVAKNKCINVINTVTDIGNPLSFEAQSSIRDYFQSLEASQDEYTWQMLLVDLSKAYHCELQQKRPYIYVFDTNPINLALDSIDSILPAHNESEVYFLNTATSVKPIAGNRHSITPYDFVNILRNSMTSVQVHSQLKHEPNRPTKFSKVPN